MSSITHCPRFVQNAWKKDLCSNCFKSKEEHAAVLQTVKPLITKPMKILAPPSKSIIKVNFPSKKSHKKKVNFPKEVSEVIGFGGEWSESDCSDGEDSGEKPVDAVVVYDDDEDTQRLTKSNTEFNQNNGNLLGDPTTNIKRSFAALKLGAPQKDSAGKKQTLKINVTPFNGAPSYAKVDPKSKIIPTESKADQKSKNGIVLKSMTLTDDTYTKPSPITQALSTTTPTPTDEADKSPDYQIKVGEKSLLEEISETLEKNNSFSKKPLVTETQEEITLENKTDVIKVEIKNNSNPTVIASAIISSNQQQTTNAATSAAINNNKRTITRNNPIQKDKEKPKIQVFSKHPESENNSDQECGTTSDYYDVVESRNSYENVPDGLDGKEKTQDVQKTDDTTDKDTLLNTKSHFFSNQTVSEMFLSHKPINDAIKKRAESYNLSDSTYVSSKITNDGLIVTHNHMNEDALDSTGSSFDSSSSSDEEMSSINRSESDSGIGIKPGNNIPLKTSICVINSSTNSSDYEDVQVSNVSQKSRELAGEPDGRSDPDGSSETSPAPALPSCPPPAEDPRPSFLHSTGKFSPDKPKVPLKPATVTVVKPFQKRQQSEMIMQLQQVISSPKTEPMSSEHLDALKASNKKTRAPEPPQGESDFCTEILKHFKEENIDNEPIRTFKEITSVKNQQKFASKTNTVQIKEPRSYPAINPKFRSLNHLNKTPQNDEKFEKFEKYPKPSTPEPAPRHSLSLSQDSLNVDLEKGKKKKFSIKKFLRMGTKTDNHSKKDYSHYADIPNIANDSVNESRVPQVKPRLIIIHPLDINTSAVQVVKSASPTTPGSDKDIFPTGIVGKPPPAPPQRADSTKLQEINKPSRPPPPKTTEMRARIESEAENKDVKYAAPNPPIDNVYANLGEVRNSIAPRKPERTASMREREAKQLEIQRRQPIGENYLDYPMDSSFSSVSSTTTKEDLSLEHQNMNDTIKSFADRSTEEVTVVKSILRSSPSPSTDSFNERKKKLLELENTHGSSPSPTSLVGPKKICSKIELFENNAIKQDFRQKSVSPIKQSTYFLNNDGLKNSVQKMNITIDSYLKNKKIMSASDTNLFNNSRSPTPTTNHQSASQEIVISTPAPITQTTTQLYGTNNNSNNNNNNRNYIRNSNNNVSNIELRSSGANYETISINGGKGSYQQRASYPENNQQQQQTSYGGIYAAPTVHSFANLPRSTTMSYCGSEMGESEIYSPYSFCGSEAGLDVAQGDPNDGYQNSSRNKTVNRLRARKGRSVVHTNLEDNYGAVIVANHEALAQVLDQLQQLPAIPSPLRPIANCINLRFDDFIIIDSSVGLVVGKRVFHQAVWNNSVYVTMVLTSDINQMVSGVCSDLNQMSGGVSGALKPITEFCDLVPSNYLPLMPSTKVQLVQATITVLPRLQVETLESLGAMMKSKKQTLFGSMMGLNGTIREGEDEDLSISDERSASEAKGLNKNGLFDDLLCREIGFIMLQFVNGLKNMQSKGIEDIPLTLSNVILCREADNKDSQARLCILQGINNLSRDEDEEMGTLCQCALKALTELLPETKLAPILSHLLLQERADTLSKIKSVLEYVLWGPADVSINGPMKEREVTLQRWLDLARATVLHGLVRSKIDLTIFDECHLMFLVRSNSKIMFDASQIIATFNANNQ